MPFKQILILNDSFIKINNQIVNKSFFSFLNDIDTQNEIIKYINQKKELNIILNTISKQSNNDITNKLNLICKKHQLNCIKIKLNNIVLWHKKKDKTTLFMISLLLVNICITFFINNNIHQLKHYQQVINKQSIKIKKTKNKISLKKLNNQEMLNQIDLLNILISTPIELKEIIISPKKIKILAKSREIEFINEFYKKITKKKQLSISIDPIYHSTYLIEASKS